MAWHACRCRVRCGWTTARQRTRRHLVERCPQPRVVAIVAGPPQLPAVQAGHVGLLHVSGVGGRPPQQFLKLGGAGAAAARLRDALSARASSPQTHADMHTAPCMVRPAGRGGCIARSCGRWCRCAEGHRLPSHPPPARSSHRGQLPAAAAPMMAAAWPVAPTPGGRHRRCAAWPALAWPWAAGSSISSRLGAVSGLGMCDLTR